MGGRLIRWTLALKDYDIKIRFIIGKENIAADILNRYFRQGEDREEQIILLFRLLETDYDEEIKKNLKNMVILQMMYIRLEKLRIKMNGETKKHMKYLKE